MIGKSINTVAESVFHGLTTNEVADTLFKTGAWKGEALTNRENGEGFPAFISINTINDVEGEVTGIIAVIRDLSVQKKQEEEDRISGFRLRKSKGFF